MNLVRALPIELARVVYGFGYSEFRDLYATVLREMVFNLKMGTIVYLNEFDKSLHEKSDKEIAEHLKWSSFCRCCERHVSNRTWLRIAPVFPGNDCPCQCRHTVRCARFVQVFRELQPHQQIGHYMRRFGSTLDTDSESDFEIDTLAGRVYY